MWCRFLGGGGGGQVIPQCTQWEMEPVGPPQMNNYQSNTYRKELAWLRFNDEPRFTLNKIRIKILNIYKATFYKIE